MCSSLARDPLSMVAACLVVMIGGMGAATATPQQVGGKPTGPLQMQAQQAVQGPLKLDVRPLKQGVRVGDKVSVEVSLLDADNKPTAASRESQVEVELAGQSGKLIRRTVSIPAGQTKTQFTFEASEAGLLSLKARETSDTLLPAGNSVLVNRTKASNKARKPKSSAFLVAPLPESVRFVTVAARPGVTPIGGGLSLGAAQEPIPSLGAVASHSPELLLNSGGKDEIFADGKDFARIQVYFVDPQGEPAPSDVKVWLTWSNGELHPQPLIIKRGEYSAEAQWVSLSPVEATVSFVASGPNYQVSTRRELKVSFVPPIYGIGSSSPNPLKLSLIDCEPVVAQFFDGEGRTVQTSKGRRITFISSNPTLHVDPSYLDVHPSESGATAFVLPTWRGRSTLDIWTPGYKHQTLEVEVTV